VGRIKDVLGACSDLRDKIQGEQILVNSVADIHPMLPGIMDSGLLGLLVFD
jgi:hypothetical protein